MSKSDRMKMLHDWRDEDFTESDSWRKRCMESYRYYTGIRQWEKADIDKLDDERRPHLTINLTFPIINTLLGHQIANKQQLALFPRKGGTVAVAALGTELLKHTMDVSDGDYHMTEVFGDGIIGAVGIVGIEKSRLNDKINGELLVRRKSPFSIIFDQNATEYDFDESGRRVFEEIWMSKEEIKIGFNKSIKDIKDATSAPRFEEEKIVTTDDYDTSRNVPKERKDQHLVNRSYWRKWLKQTYLVDLEQWSARLLKGPKMIEFAKRAVERHKADAREFGVDPVMAIIERAGWMLYETWFVGEMELLHIENPWNGIMRFPMMTYYPYWADGYPLGVIDNLKDPQKELNKRVSQELHILNTTPNAGWYVEEAMDPEALQDLKEHGSETGYVLDRSKFGGKAEKMKPNQLSVGHNLIAQQRADDLDRISGVDPNLRGQTERQESGKALNIRMGANIMVSGIIFNNFNRTQKKVAKFLWDAIRQKDESGQSLYYSQNEIESIVQEASLKDFIQQDAQGNQTVDLSPFYQEDIGNYGVKVSTSPSTPTIRMENLELLLRIAERYPPGPDGRAVIPPEFLIELTDIPQKEELVERLQKVSQQMQQMVGQGAA